MPTPKVYIGSFKSVLRRYKNVKKFEDITEPSNLWCFEMNKHNYNTFVFGRYIV